MMKVILETETDRRVDLLPENMPVREALEQLHADPDSALFLANGRFLTEEDLEKTLRRYGADEEVQFTSLPKPDQEPPETDTASDAAPENKESLAMEKVRSLLCEALTIMNTVLKQSGEEPPF